MADNQRVIVVVYQKCNTLFYSVLHFGLYVFCQSVSPMILSGVMTTCSTVPTRLSL